MVSFNPFYGAESLDKLIGWFYKHYVPTWSFKTIVTLLERRMSLVHRLVNWQVSKIIANESRVGRTIRPPRRQVIGPYSNSRHSPSTTAAADNNSNRRDIPAALMSLSMSMSPESAFSPPEATPLAPRPTHPSDPAMQSPDPSPASQTYEMSFPEVISNGAFSKTWVLPPRKKPGRKAANDVPPTVRVLRVFLHGVCWVCCGRGANGRNGRRRIGRRRRRFGIGRRIGWWSWSWRMMS